MEEPPPSPPHQPEVLQVQEELAQIEGGGQGKSRRLSSEDIESLISGDEVYTSERQRRRPSELAKLLQAGSLRSSTCSDFEQLQQETEEETKTEIQETSEEHRLDGTSSHRLERHLSWNEVVHVHLHEMILGYNFGVSSGAPVELSWTQLDEFDTEISEKISKSMKELKIPSGVRFMLSREAGATAVQIMSRIEAVDIMRQQLVASCKKAKMEDMKTLKAAKKAAAKKKKPKADGPEQGGCCIIL